MMSYRSPEPKPPFVLRVSPVPLKLLIGFAVLVAALVGLAHLLTPMTFVTCSRASDTAAWSCEVRGFPRGDHRTYDLVGASSPSSGIDLPPVALKPLDDGGGMLVAGNLELARFPLREVRAASIATRELVALMSEGGAREATVIVRQPPGDSLLVMAALPVLGLFALWLFFRPSTFVVDPESALLEVELRSTPFTRTRFTTSLSKIVGISPGHDLDVAITLADGTVHHVTPLGWTERMVARRARELREAVEAAT